MKILYESEDIHVRVWCPSTYCIGFTQENEEESETAEDGEGAGDEDSDEDESDDKDENESKFNVRTRNICAETEPPFFLSVFYFTDLSVFKTFEQVSLPLLFSIHRRLTDVWKYDTHADIVFYSHHQRLRQIKKTAGSPSSPNRRARNVTFACGNVLFFVLFFFCF